jgi:predicted neuraminidase
LLAVSAKRRIVFLLFLLCQLIAAGQGKWTKISDQLIFDHPPFPSCHASTIVQRNDGRLVVACFAGSQEGKEDVSIWFGELAGNRVVPRKIADGYVDKTTQYPCWNPVLFKTRSGQLIVFYKVGPNPREWLGMYKTSGDGGTTWSSAKRLPPGITGPVKNKPAYQEDGSILCPSSIEFPNGKWQVVMQRCDATLKHWHSVAVDTASTFDVIQPSILRYGNGQLQILCRSKQGNVIQARSSDDGKTWSSLSRTQLLNPNSGTDAVTLKDGTQLIVYNPAIPGKDWFNGRSELRVAESADGDTWTDIMTLEHGTTEEYSYPAIIQSTDGKVHITYTYDRKNIKHVVIERK